MEVGEEIHMQHGTAGNVDRETPSNHLSSSSILKQIKQNNIKS